MRVASYLRISRDKAGQELGVTRQREDCQALAASRGWTVRREFIDNDISAYSGRRRPEYQALMAAIERGEVDTVLVYMTSRLWRNRKERAIGMELFQAKRIRLVPVKGPEVDCSTASGRLVAGILGEMDTAESDIKSERLKREARQRAEQSRPHGGRKTYGIAANGRDVIETEADDIRRWYAAIHAGGSIVAIQRETGWHHATVSHILRNRRYIGERVHEGTVYPTPHAAIVEPMLWHAVQAILADPRRKSNKDGKANRWLGSGLYRCDECDIPVKVNYGSSRGIRMYHCPKVVKGGCGRTWQAERIDAWVEAVACERLGQDDLRDLLAGNRDDPSAKLAAQAATLRTRIAQLGVAFADDDEADPDDYKAAVKGLRDRLADVEAQLADMTADNALASLAGPDPAARWLELEDVGRRRAVLARLMTVRLRPGKRGNPRQEWIPTDTVVISWDD